MRGLIVALIFLAAVFYGLYEVVKPLMSLI